MKLRRAGKAGLWLLATAIVAPACGPRQPKDLNDIVPTFSANRMQIPLKSAIEATYTWECGPAMKKLSEEYRVFVHFVDKDGTLLFTDDHLPTPLATTWEPGKKYSYTRTVFVPSYSYVGPVTVRIGLAALSGGRKPRVALKANHVGLGEYAVGKLEFLHETKNIYVVQKEGWHDPETDPNNPGVERVWTRKEALVSFQNPKKDVIVYLEANTSYKSFSQPPVLTVSVGKSGVVIPIPDSDIFLKKMRFRAADLGDGEWVDLHLSMNDSFCPKNLGFNTDPRELGLMVSHLFVIEESLVGSLPTEGVFNATALPAATTAKTPAARAAAAKPTTNAAKPTATAAKPKASPKAH
jgi:hypothetical protein